MSIFQNPRERRRFLRFAVVGIIGAIVDFGTFNILSSWLHVLPVLASVCSFSAAVISNFVWNRYWTYPDSRSKAVHHQLLQFGFINLIGLGIRTPLFAYLEKRLPTVLSGFRLPDRWYLAPVFLGHNLALAVAVVVVMFWNFYVNRYLTYNDVE